MVSMYDDIRIHVARLYTSSSSLLVDNITHSVQQFSSSIPSPLYFHLHRLPSYIVPLSSLYMPIPLQTTILSFLSIFPTFVVPLIISFLILSSFVTPHIHRSIRMCDLFHIYFHVPYSISMHVSCSVHR